MTEPLKGLLLLNRSKSNLRQTLSLALLELLIIPAQNLKRMKKKRVLLLLVNKYCKARGTTDGEGLLRRSRAFNPFLAQLDLNKCPPPAEEHDNVVEPTKASGVGGVTSM